MKSCFILIVFFLILNATSIRADEYWLGVRVLDDNGKATGEFPVVINYQGHGFKDYDAKLEYTTTFDSISLEENALKPLTYNIESLNFGMKFEIHLRKIGESSYSGSFSFENKQLIHLDGSLGGRAFPRMSNYSINRKFKNLVFGKEMEFDFNIGKHKGKIILRLEQDVIENLKIN
tara:strand:+ start:762 stop:1289 length:528 start_codon:yes stop_codon:yes gene_type:complete